jgi:ribosome-associated protein
MEMAGTSSICEFFVVMDATSNVRVKAVVDAIEDAAEKKKTRPVHREGYNEGVWVLLDYGDVIVHVFHHETRHFYNLENLWGDVPQHKFSMFMVA